MDQNLDVVGDYHDHQYHDHDHSNVDMINIPNYERKLPSSTYKGVVPQPNGRWGAQIYQKHQRIWLGTFNDEEQAARAYDIAVLRFRGPEPATSASDNHASFFLDSSSHYVDNNNNNDNGPVLDLESIFLFSHSKAEIVDMLRKHTYYDELEQYKCHYPNPSTSTNISFYHNHGLTYGSCSNSNDTMLEYLFEKVATASDVGKLNRFVVPKQHAENHFPLNHGSSSSSKGVLMNFEDSEGKVWRFRYSYWGSSHSYVFSKGWTSFVKEKDLKVGDVVIFRKWRNNGRFFIDCAKGKQCEEEEEEIVMQDGGGDHDMIVESGQVARPGRPGIKLFGVTLF